MKSFGGVQGQRPCSHPPKLLPIPVEPRPLLKRQLLGAGTGFGRLAHGQVTDQIKVLGHIHQVSHAAADAIHVGDVAFHPAAFVAKGADGQQGICFTRSSDCI